MSLETMTKLASTTISVGGTTSSVTFSNIPQGYTDLVIKSSCRNDRNAGDSANFSLRFNGDTSTSYYDRYLYSYINSGLTALDSLGTATSFRLGGINQATQTASVFSNNEFYVFNYSGNTLKNINSEWALENNGATNYLGLSTGYWNNSAPVTSLTIFIDDTNVYYVANTTFTLYGVKNAAKTAGNSIKATGGNIIFDGTYVTHTFTSTGAFIPTQALTVDYLVVAGGGGGGFGTGSGGGGAGGYRTTVGTAGGGGTLDSPISLSPNSYAVTIGAGGAGLAQNPGTVYGNSGSNSNFATIASTGGGGGGGENASVKNGVTGGSGGGGSYISSGVGGSGTANQGYGGGNGYTNSTNYAGGGGGGAGSAGATMTSGYIGGAGGAGITSSISGTSVAYAGGGGGSGQTTANTQAYGGAGGSSIGGTGAGYLTNSTGISATSGVINTGSGGGGGGAFTGGGSGSGSSGIVIIRYKG